MRCKNQLAAVSRKDLSGRWPYVSEKCSGSLIVHRTLVSFDVYWMVEIRFCVEFHASLRVEKELQGSVQRLQHSIQLK